MVKEKYIFFTLYIFKYSYALVPRGWEPIAVLWGGLLHSSLIPLHHPHHHHPPPAGVEPVWDQDQDKPSRQYHPRWGCGIYNVKTLVFKKRKKVSFQLGNPTNTNIYLIRETLGMPY